MAAKKCTKCGEEKPLDQFYKFKLGKFGRQAECKVCSDARRRLRAAARPDLERQSRREWARKNPEKVRASNAKKRARPEYAEYMKAYGKAWYERNRERLKAIRKAWHLKNKDQRNANALAYYYADSERWRKYNKQWAAEHRGKMRAYTAVSDAKRRAAKVSSPGHYSAKDIEEIRLKQRGRCAVCKVLFGNKFHRDHIIALASGGTNDKHNIQLLCKSCNSRKHKKDPIRFMQENGYLI